MDNLLEHISKEARGGACSLKDSLPFLDVIDNWVYDRALNLVFMDLPIGSHEWFLASLEIWHNLNPEEQTKGWIDQMVGSDTWAKLADQWLQKKKAFTYPPVLIPFGPKSFPLWKDVCSMA